MAAYTRGGWPHFQAETFFHDGTMADVNYRTGEMTLLTGTSWMYPFPWWGSREPHFLGEGI